MDGNRPVGEVTGVILAGGEARRFRGLAKALLEVHGQRIIDRQLAALRATTVAQFIVANAAAAFSDSGVPVIADRVVGAGPLGGLHAALEAATTSHVLVLACDMPFVTADFLRYLVARAPLNDIVVPRTRDGLHPLCATYATRLRPIVSARLQQQRLALHDLFAECSCEYVEPAVVAAYDRDSRLLANVNSPADYEALTRSEWA